MKRIRLSLTATACLALMACSVLAHAADGMIQLKSPLTVKQTMNQFVHTARSKNLTIFATVDHAAGAKRVDLDLRPTTVVIFGNPKAGTPFMQCAQTVGIDLPMKVLIWQDAGGQVWLGYNDPAYIAKRHGVDNCPAVPAISNTLSALMQATISENDDS